LVIIIRRCEVKPKKLTKTPSHTLPEPQVKSGKMRRSSPFTGISQQANVVKSKISETIHPKKPGRKVIFEIAGWSSH